MPTDTEDAASADPMEDAEEWQALDREEQSAILDDGLADLRGDTDGEEFRHLDEQTQEETIAAVERGELSETERAMQAALEETFTVEVFGELEDVPTVPFECRPLSTPQQERLDEAMQFLAAIEGTADADSVADVDVGQMTVDNSEHFATAADVESWLPEFLAAVTTDEAFDAERWREGRSIRSGTREQLLIDLYIHHHEETERAIKFRAESGG